MLLKRDQQHWLYLGIFRTCRISIPTDLNLKYRLNLNYRFRICILTRSPGDLNVHYAVRSTGLMGFTIRCTNDVPDFIGGPTYVTIGRPFLWRRTLELCWELINWLWAFPEYMGAGRKLWIPADFHVILLLALCLPTAFHWVRVYRKEIFGGGNGGRGGSRVSGGWERV